ncbi:MAG TPA: hypothetical protein VJS44_16995 [Pyrinomonadaceae bacterium]|nr:hypothetical protein [Pyrinomonadaceae bacterium]
MDYEINISIDSQGLKQIYGAGQSVTLVKSIVSNPATTNPIAWISFQPLQENQVSWQVDYYIYGTTTVLQSGATIIMTSQTDTPVQRGWTYTFAQGMFTGGSGTGTSFNVLNNTPTGSFNFGLAQQATVNNVKTIAPLNAAPVLYNQTGAFTPQEIVSIFLSSYSNNGTVITNVAGNALAVTLSSSAPTANVAFNDATNTFYLIQPGALVEGQPSRAELFAQRLLSSRRSALGLLQQ